MPTMNHRHTLNTCITTLATCTTLLNAALTATEDIPLHSNTGGGQPKGSHSDPTPNAATRRRNTTERRNIDHALADLHTATRNLHQHLTTATTPTPKTGPCWVCNRGRLTQPLGPTGLCDRCTKTFHNASRRAITRGHELDETTWRKQRTTELKAS